MIVLHLHTAREWTAREDQLRILMRGLARSGVEQTCFCRAGGGLEKRLVAEGLPIEPIRWGGMSIGVRRMLHRRFRTADVVHVHDDVALELAALPARLRKRPLVVTRPDARPVKPAVYQKATQIIAISAFVGQSLIESGIAADRIRVIHSAIDLDDVRGLQPASPSFRDRMGIEADRFVAATVGALLPDENQKLIPRAAAQERRVVWVVVGDGPERAAIEAGVSAHGVMANVRMAGAPTDPRPYFHEFDVFVLAARGKPFGLRILDAMALDVPVIAPDEAGPGEILGPVHANTGISLYPPGDAVALARAVRRVRDEPGLAGRMREAQRRRVEEFGVERMVEKALALYREVAETA